MSHLSPDQCILVKRFSTLKSVDLFNQFLAICKLWVFLAHHLPDLCCQSIVKVTETAHSLGNFCQLVLSLSAVTVQLEFTEGLHQDHLWAAFFDPGHDGLAFHCHGQSSIVISILDNLFHHVDKLITFFFVHRKCMEPCREVEKANRLIRWCNAHKLLDNKSVI